MNKLIFILTALLPMIGMAAPPQKKVDDVNVLTIPPVSIEGAVTVNSGGIPLPVEQTLSRQAYLGQTGASDTSVNNRCEAELTAPAGLVIETLSFFAETDWDTRHFDEYVTVSVTTDLSSRVTGQFHFPTANKVYWFREPISPYSPVTRYRNTMSLRLYPDEGSLVRLSVEIINPDDLFESYAFNSCNLWVSGYLIQDSNTGLGP
jgi:hypothetical protein